MTKNDSTPVSAQSMQRYTLIQPTVVEGSPDAHNVFLRVTNQQFCVTPYALDTKEEAEWTRDMLCIALAKIVEDSTMTLTRDQRPHVGATYTSGSLLHQRKVLRVDDDLLTYRVISSHAEAVIGSVHECFTSEFSRWAKRTV